MHSVVFLCITYVSDGLRTEFRFGCLRRWRLVKCGRLSQLSWLLGALWYSLSYLLTQFTNMYTDVFYIQVRLYSRHVTYTLAHVQGTRSCNEVGRRPGEPATKDDGLGSRRKRQAILQTVRGSSRIRTDNGRRWRWRARAGLWRTNGVVLSWNLLLHMRIVYTAF